MTNIEHALFEAIVQEIEQEKVDALALLQLQIQCSQVKTFPEFCNTLTVEEWSETTQTDMILWQTALGLTTEKMHVLMNLPLTKLTAAIHTLNLKRILDAADAVNAVLPAGVGG